MSRTSNRPRTSGALIALTVVLGGCAGTIGGGSAVDEMHAHFAITGELRAAALIGDLEALKDAAGRLARRGAVEGLPREAYPRLYELRRRAEELGTVETIEQATWGSALLIAECGGCHSEAGAGPAGSFVVGSPPEYLGSDAHAALQGWAMERLWEGVIGPADGPWLAGGLVMSEDEAMTARPDVGLAIRMVREATSLDDRARALGAVLNSCVGCHTG